MRNRPDCSISLCICKRSLSRLHHSNRLTKASAISFSCLGKLAQAAVRTSGPIRDGASQVRRFFHDDAHRTLGSAASPTGARRPQPRPDAQSGAPRSPRIADGRCRAACSGPHPCGRRGIPPTLSSAARSDSQMMVQIDFTRMDDDADLHNKYCALKPTLKSSRNSFQNSPLVPEESGLLWL
jgi:hypothetical protein